YGPRPTHHKSKSGTTGTINTEFKFAPFSNKLRRGYQKDSQERDFSNLLTQSLSPSIRLDTFPKSQLDIFIHVLESDGAAASLATAISCASLALADAGIEMFDLVTACSVGISSSGKLVMDCDGEEEEEIAGSLMFAYMPSVREVTHLLQNGEVGVQACMEALDMCVDACTKIYTVSKQVLVEQFNATAEPF
ncbi:Exosome complex component MTR3, partial [Blyttiomyces sp. JEL0837]